MIQKIGRAARRDKLDRPSSLAFESLEPRNLLAANTPSFLTIGDQDVAFGAPLHIGINGDHGLGENITYTVESSSANLHAEILSGNRSWRLDVQDHGTMIFEFFEQRAPRTTAQFAELIEGDFYDNKEFIRIVENFVIQATGAVSPLEDFNDEFHLDLSHNQIGTLSMAKAAEDDNNAEFFVTLNKPRHLDSHHSVFGLLTDGLDALQSIGNAPTDPDSPGGSRPANPVVITNSELFTDNENGTLMLKALVDPDGNDQGLGILALQDPIEVTVTATDESGNSFSETFEVTITDDTSNARPWQEEIPLFSVLAGETSSVDINFFDPEGDDVVVYVPEFTPGVQGDVVSETLQLSGQTGSTTVTFTPQPGFVGRGAFSAYVYDPLRIPSGFTDYSSFDSQLVYFDIDPPTPTSVDLLASSDSGASNTDNDTDLESLTFRVDGVTHGLTVKVLADGVEVGQTVVGEGETSVDVTVASYLLAHGANSITAVQYGEGTNFELGNVTPATKTSDPTAALTVTLDRSQHGIQPAIPTSAIVTVPFVYNASHYSEDGTANVYSLDAAPTGMSIDAKTGEITWTPTSDQLGNNTVTIKATHAGGEDTISATVVVDLPAPTGVDLLDDFDTGRFNSDDVTNLTNLSFLVSGVLPGATVEIFDGDSPTAIGSAVVGDGESTVVVAMNEGIELTDGVHSITAKQTINPTSAASTALDVTIDTTLGELVLDQPQKTVAENLFVTFAADFDASTETDIRFTLVDPVPGMTLPKSDLGAVHYQPRADQIGDVPFTIRLTDLAGNTKEVSGSIEVVPAAPTDVNIAPESDSGASNSDNFTNITTPSFVVSGVVPNALVRVYVDDVEVASVTAPDGPPGDRLDVTVPYNAVGGPLAEGIYTIRATQELNTPSPKSAGTTIGVDLTEPVDTTGIAPSEVTVGEQFYFDLGHPQEGTLRFSYEEVDFPEGMTIDTVTGEIRWTPAPGQSGTVIYGFNAVDAAGNAHYVSYLVRVLPQAPTEIKLLADDDTGASDSDDLTNKTMPRFLVSGVESGAIVRLFVGDTNFGVDVVPDDQTSVIIETQLEDFFVEGLNTIRGAQMSNSQVSEFTNYEFSLDTTAPAANTGTAPNSATAGVLYEFDPGNTEEGDPGFSYALKDAPAGMTINADTGKVSWTPTNGQAGSQSFKIVAIDDAGNETDNEYSVDVIPDAPDGVDLLAAYDSGFSNSDNLTNLTTLRFLVSGVIEGATVRLFSGNAEVGSAVVASGQTTVEVEATGLVEGAQTITAKQSNAPTAASSPGLQIEIDLTAPAAFSVPLPVQAIAGVEYQYNPANPEEGNTGFSYSLDNPPAGMTIDPATGEVSWTPALGQVGNQTVTVIATDAAGNETSTSATVSVALPTGAPASVDLLADDDHGSSNTDNVTNVTTPRFRVQAVSPGATVKLFANGNLIGEKVVPVDQVFVIITPDAPLPEGDYQITATQTSVTESDPSDALTIDIDTTAPGPITPNLPTSVTAGTPYIYDAQHDEEGVNGFKYSLGDAPAGMTIDADTGVISWTPTNDQAGIHDITVIGRDLAGNGNSVRETEVEVIPAAPTGIDLLPESDSGASDSDNITNLTTLSFLVSGVTSGATVTIFAGDTAVGSAVVENGQTTVVVTTDNPTAIAEGANSFTATQTVNPTSEASDALVVTVDTVAPEAITPEIPTSIIAGNLFSYDADNVEEGDTGFSYSLDNPPAGMTINAATGEVSWTPSNDQIGNQTVTIAATDIAGNETTISAVVEVAPAAPTDIDLLPGSDSGISDSDNLTNLTTLDFLVSGVVPGATVTLYSGVTEIGSAVVAGGESTVVVTTNNPAGLTEGVNSITATQTVNPTSAASAALNVTIDTVSPIAGVPSTALDAIAGLPFIFDTQNPEEGTAGFRYSLTDAPAGATINPVTGEITWTPTETQTGEQTIKVTATDAAGNQTTALTAIVEVKQLIRDTKIETDEDTTYRGSWQQISQEPIDPKDVHVAEHGKHGDVQFLANGQFSYTPHADFSGVDEFTLSLFNDLVTANFQVVVNEVNDLPYANDDKFVVDQASKLNQLNATSNDGTEPDVNETLRIIRVGNPSQGGTATVSEDGRNVVYTPAAGFTGTEIIRYTVDDGRGGQANGSITVVVDPIANPNVNSLGDTQSIFVVDTSSSGDNGSGSNSDPIGVQAQFVPASQSTGTGRSAFIDGGGNGVAAANRAIYANVYKIFSNLPDVLNETVERLNQDGNASITAAEANAALQKLQQSLANEQSTDPFNSLFESEDATVKLPGEQDLENLLQSGGTSSLPAEFWAALEEALQQIIKTSNTEATEGSDAQAKAGEDSDAAAQVAAREEQIATVNDPANDSTETNHAATLVSSAALASTVSLRRRQEQQRRHDLRRKKPR